MKDTYKGYEITYLESNEEFTARIGDSSYANRSLSAVKKYIDNLDKKDFKRVDVIIEDHSGYQFGVVTSCAKSTHYGGLPGIDCWISLKNGSRKKKDIESVYLDNKKNREILELIKDKEEAIRVLQESRRNLRSSFEKYAYEMK